MDLGLDSREARDALNKCLDTIELVEERAFRVLPGNPGYLGRPGSHIAKLDESATRPVGRRPCHPVAGHCCMPQLPRQIRTTVIGGVSTSPEVLATLCRTALMSASRVVFVIGPA